jgi:hypothetical protein
MEKLVYLPQWTAHGKHAGFNGLNTVCFSPDGSLLACCSSKCILFLCAATGSVITRLWYPKRAVATLWLSGGFTKPACAFEDGAIMTLELLEVSFNLMS